MIDIEHGVAIPEERIAIAAHQRLSGIGLGQIEIQITDQRLVVVPIDQVRMDVDLHPCLRLSEPDPRVSEQPHPGRRFTQ